MLQINDEDFLDNSNINNNTKCSIIKEYLIKCLIICFISLCIYTIIISYLFFYKFDDTNINITMTCQIMNYGSVHSYPSIDTYIYAINFNKTIMQANYVFYISTGGGNSDGNIHWKKDPYEINDLRTTDYTNTGYDRGHLVPNADYGLSTYIISNAVPMVPNLNRGSWKKSERHIRNKYTGKLIYKGCKYSENNIVNNKLYIPEGCYYIVFNISTIPKIFDNIVGTILDYGYYINDVDSKKQYELPFWANCMNVAILDEQ